MSTLWQASMKDIENIDFVYVFVNMLYEPMVWLILFFGVILGYLFMNCLNKW